MGDLFYLADLEILIHQLVRFMYVHLDWCVLALTGVEDLHGVNSDNMFNVTETIIFLIHSCTLRERSCLKG